MTQTVDTNVLVYASNVDATEHGRAAALLDHLAAGPGLVVVLWPTVMSYLRIVTHPSIFERPLRHADAVDNVDRLIARPNIRAVAEGAAFWRSYGEATAAMTVRGNLVPDAHLVGLMVENGISTIWSHDRDLRKFDGIRVADPFDDQYAHGFAL